MATDKAKTTILFTISTGKIPEKQFILQTACTTAYITGGSIKLVLLYPACPNKRNIKKPSDKMQSIVHSTTFIIIIKVFISSEIFSNVFTNNKRPAVHTK